MKIMKIKIKFRPAAAGIFLAALIWIILPYFFIMLNQSLTLPVINFLPLKIIGGILVGAGFITVCYLIKLFLKFGQGTPVPFDPAKKLIYRGLYRHTRNPMYLSHLLIFFGEFLLTGYTILLVYLVLAWFGFHLFIIRWEEPDLKKRLGRPYLKYIRRVPRWL